MITVGYRLGVDFGTSNTVAVVYEPDGRSRPVLFDGFPLLPSSVCVAPDGRGLLVGREAIHAARVQPERFEPHPKRRVDDGTVLLGDAEFPVAHLIAAVLAQVKAEAVRMMGGPPATVVLTCPAAWASRRRAVLSEAAGLAGLENPELVPEPVAAAAYFVHGTGVTVPVSSCVVVYDFGAGTFDASVVRRTADGWEVVASDGLADAGGLDVDAAVVAYLGAVYSATHPEQMRRLDRPSAVGDRRAHRNLWEDVRTAKEILSRSSSTYIHVPILEQDAPLGREQLERLARPVVDRTVTLTRTVLAASVPQGRLAGLFLVGGSSRMPLVATLLHQLTGVAPTVMEQPELVVAEGSARPLTSTGAQPIVPAPPAPPTLPATPPLPAPREPDDSGAARGTASVSGAAPVSQATATFAAQATPPPAGRVPEQPRLQPQPAAFASQAAPAAPAPPAVEAATAGERRAPGRAGLALVVAGILLVVLIVLDLAGRKASEEGTGLPEGFIAWHTWIAGRELALYPGFLLWFAYLFSAPRSRLLPRLLVTAVLIAPLVDVLYRAAIAVGVWISPTGGFLVLLVLLVGAAVLLALRRKVDGSEVRAVFGRADAGGLLLGLFIVVLVHAPDFDYAVDAVTGGDITLWDAIRFDEVPWLDWFGYALLATLAFIGLGAAIGRFVAAGSPTARRWLPKVAAGLLGIGALVTVSQVAADLFNS